MSALNDNYAFVLYDVHKNRVSKVFKICRKYLIHFQKSVFRGEITHSKLNELKDELYQIVNENEDFICFITLFNGKIFHEETIGNRKTGEELFL